MSQGDLWTWNKTGEQGIEVSRNKDYLKLALIDDTWPFPLPPVWVLKSQCRRAPMKYYHEETIEEALL
jgi:hypothetical protein